MNNQDDADESAKREEAGQFDPRAAAVLLQQTKKQAERQFDIGPPLLMLIGALVVLVAYGAVWLSVRGQHPYSGPSGTALAVLYGTLIVWIGLVGTFFKRATSGISGRSSRQQKADGAAFATVLASVYVFQGALYHAGASHAIVYGTYPAVAPIIILGGAAAAHAAARENWRVLAFAVPAIVLAAGAAFASPAGVWGVMGIGLCALLLARTTAQAWLRRK